MSDSPPPPPTPPPPPPAVVQDAKGYLSPEDKRKFTMTAGVLGAVCFIVQMVLPFAVMMPLMPGMMFRHMATIKVRQTERGALWEGEIWFVEQPAAGLDGQGKALLKRLPVGSEEDPVTAAELSVDEPWLLAGEDRLWILSTSGVRYYAGGRVHREPNPRPRADMSQPFLYKGRPATIEWGPRGYRLAVYANGRWVSKGRLAFDTGVFARVLDKLQVVPDGPTLHVFRQFGSTLYYREGLPTGPNASQQSWQTVCSVDEDWYAALADGRPVVFRLPARGETRRTLSGYRQSGDTWERFYSHKAGLVDGLGVFALSPERLVVVAQSPMSAMRTIEIADGQTTRERRYGKGSGLPGWFLPTMLFPHIISYLAPLVFALILSGLMRKHRVCHYEAAGVRMPLASVGRRAIAQAVDTTLLMAPAAVGWLMAMTTAMDSGRLVDGGGWDHVLAGFGLICGGLVWLLAGFLIFAGMEGRSGRTPGKWIAGIRVLGADLVPCGFGRALVRNLLKIVDGFFNFLIAVMLVALTEKWQRLGDMAARTVVVDVRKSATRQGQSG